MAAPTAPLRIYDIHHPALNGRIRSVSVANSYDQTPEHFTGGQQHRRRWQFAVADDPWTLQSLVGAIVEVAVGRPDRSPLDGTFTASYNSTTDGLTNLAVNISAEDFETALNTNALIDAAGGVTVTKVGGLYTIRFADPGARSALSYDVEEITPLASVVAREVQTGDSDTPSIQTFRIVQQPFAYVSLSGADISTTTATGELVFNRPALAAAFAETDAETLSAVHTIRITWPSETPETVYSAPCVVHRDLLDYTGTLPEVPDGFAYIVLSEDGTEVVSPALETIQTSLGITAGSFDATITALTGGGATALDGQDITTFSEGEGVTFKVGDAFYSYRVADTGSLPAEQSPKYILPDTASGTKFWICDFYAADQDGGGDPDDLTFTRAVNAEAFVGSVSATTLSASSTTALTGTATLSQRILFDTTAVSTINLATQAGIFEMKGKTITSPNTGTIATAAVASVAQSTLAATGTTTFTVAASLYIPSAPAAGSNVTITDSFAIYAGPSYLSTLLTNSINGLLINSTSATLSITSGTTVSFGSTFSTSAHTLTTNGVTYTLPGTTATLADAAAVLALTGGTMSGNITFNDTGEGIVFHGGGTITGASGDIKITSTVADRINYNSGSGIHTFKRNGVNKWHIWNNDNILAETDNAFDIGASGANRPRSIYVGTSGVFGGSVTIGGVAAAATTAYTITKLVSSIADNTATTILTITIPNGAHAGVVKLTALGRIGAGGSIGADESVESVSYDIAVCRVAGVNAAADISTIYGDADPVVAGGANDVVTVTVAAVSGAVGATNTFAVQVTIATPGNSADNHACTLMATLINANASGITIA